MAQNKEAHMDISSDVQLKYISVTSCLVFSEICLAIQLYNREVLDVYINYCCISNHPKLNGLTQKILILMPLWIFRV